MVKSDSAETAPAPGAQLYGFYVSALTISLVGNLVIRVGARGGWLPPEAQAGVAILAAAPLWLGAALFWRMLRRDLDELFQRILLEGLAFAFVLYVPMAAAYVNLRTAGVWTPRLDAPDILLIPAWLAAVGVLIAWRRFQ